MKYLSVSMMLPCKVKTKLIHLVPALGLVFDYTLERLSKIAATVYVLAMVRAFEKRQSNICTNAQ